MLSSRAFDRLTDATAFPVTEGLTGWTLIVDAALLAADLVCATGRTILLAEAWITVAGIRVALLAFFTRIVAGSLATAFVFTAAALLTDRAAVAGFFLRRFVGVGSALGDCRVIEKGIRATGVAHIPIDDSSARIRLRARGAHIRQERLIAVTFDVVARVVADVVVITGRGEIDIAGEANLVGNEVADDAIRRAAAVEFRHMPGMGHTIGAKSEIGDRVERLQAGRLATLQAGHIGHAVAQWRSSCFGHLRRAQPG